MKSVSINIVETGQWKISLCLKEKHYYRTLITCIFHWQLICPGIEYKTSKQRNLEAMQN